MELSPERELVASQSREYIQALIARTIIRQTVALPSIIVGRQRGQPNQNTNT